jgi:hypothetical protein
MKHLPITENLEEIAADWELMLMPIEKGCYRLMPDIILGIHGVWCNEENDVWHFWREDDATTWEDFLLMHITHRLAAQHGSLLYYDYGHTEKIIEPELYAFANFDTYAEFVVRKESGLVRDIKKNWMYTHQKRIR